MFLNRTNLTCLASLLFVLLVGFAANSTEESEELRLFHYKEAVRAADSHGLYVRPATPAEKNTHFRKGQDGLQFQYFSGRVSGDDVLVDSAAWIAYLNKDGVICDNNVPVLERTPDGFLTFETVLAYHEKDDHGQPHEIIVVIGGHDISRTDFVSNPELPSRPR